MGKDVDGAWRLRRNRSRGRVWVNGGLTAIAALCTLCAILPLFAVLIYVLVKGVQRLDLALVTQLPPPPMGDGGGLGNAILGTLIIVTLATGIAVPGGVLAALYLAEYSTDAPLGRNIRFAANVLSGVPSIIAGVFAYGLLVVTGLTGYSAVAGGVALAVLMVPTILRATDEALQLVPQDIRLGAIAVGATRYQSILHILLPAAMPSMLTGIVLAIARASGETAPLIFTALNSSFWPQDVFEPIASLSVTIYNFAIVPFENQQRLAWAGSLILIILVLITSITARWINYRATKLN